MVYGYMKIALGFYRAKYQAGPWKRAGTGVGGLSNTPGGWGGRTFDRDNQFDSDQRKISLDHAGATGLQRADGSTELRMSHGRFMKRSESVGWCQGRNRTTDTAIFNLIF